MNGGEGIPSSTSSLRPNPTLPTRITNWHEIRQNQRYSRTSGRILIISERQQVRYATDLRRYLRVFRFPLFPVGSLDAASDFRATLATDCERSAVCDQWSRLA